MPQLVGEVQAALVVHGNEATIEWGGEVLFPGLKEQLAEEWRVCEEKE